jgi:hypothetical protein
VLVSFALISIRFAILTADSALPLLGAYRGLEVTCLNSKRSAKRRNSA